MKILINRSDALGDTILTIPLAQVIKEIYPAAKVYYLISPVCAPLFEQQPHIDGIFFNPAKVLGKKNFCQNLVNFIQSFFYFWQQLKNHQWTHYFYIGGDTAPSAVALFLRIPFRGGILHKVLSYLYLNKGVRQKRSQVLHHEALYNLLVLKDLFPIDYFNQKINSPQTWSPKLFVQAEEIKAVQASFPFHQNQNEYGVIHPGMRGHTLNWPIPAYTLLLEKCLNEHFPSPHFHWIISFTSVDRSYMEEFEKSFYEKFPDGHPRVLFWNGETQGLRFYLALLKAAKCFIGPSTGTLHMAQALEVPLLTFFSPIKVQSAKRWGPFYPKAPAIILTPHNSYAKDCKDRKDCMEEISVEEAYASLQKLFH